MNLLLSILLGAGVFIFFGVYYPYHLHYQEQFQMFLFTSGYFVERASHPGGVADYLGNFLTQFYYYSWAGAAVLAGVLWGMQRLVAFIAGRMGECSLWYPLTLLPSLCFFILLCDENYLLSGVLSACMVLGQLRDIPVFSILSYAVSPFGQAFRYSICWREVVPGCSSRWL